MAGSIGGKGYVLGLVMDWLCLHLDEKRLAAGFRPGARGGGRATVSALTSCPAGSASVLAGPVAGISVVRPSRHGGGGKAAARELSFKRLGFTADEGAWACRASSTPRARTRSRREPQKNRTAPSGPSRGSLPRPVSTTIRGGYNGGPVLRCTGTGRRGDGAPRHLRVWLRDSPVRRGRGRGDAPRRARDGGGVAWAAAGRRRGGLTGPGSTCCCTRGTPRAGRW